MKKEVVVGLFGVVASAILYFGFNFLKGEEFFSAQNKYVVRYVDIDGLALGNPVFINGFKVGKVLDIQLEHERGDSLLVEIGVKSNIQIGDGTIAQLASNGLLEGKCVVLQLSFNNVLYESGAALRPSYEPSITKMIEERAIPVITNLDSTIVSLNKFLDEENQTNLAESFASLNRAIKTFENTSYQLNQMVRNNNHAVTSIMTNMASFTDSLNMLAGEFHPLITKMDALADSLNNLELKETVDNLNGVLVNMESITAKIDSGQGTIGKLVNEDSLAVSMNRSVSDLDSLLVDFKANPNRYVQVSVFGKKDKTKKKKKSKK